MVGQKAHCTLVSLSWGACDVTQCTIVNYDTQLTTKEIACLVSLRLPVVFECGDPN